jgi:hypothetical protein
MSPTVWTKRVTPLTLLWLVSGGAGKQECSCSVETSPLDPLPKTGPHSAAGELVLGTQTPEKQCEAFKKWEHKRYNETKESS